MARCMVCGSESQTVRKKTAINGALMVACQCDECGQKVGNWIKHIDLPEPAAQFPDWKNERFDRAQCPTCGSMHTVAFWRHRA